MAGRLFDRLTSSFGNENVFIDIDAVPLGVDFRDHLRNAVYKCDIFLALIGSDWLTGNRLADPTDWVRIEIEAALSRDQIIAIPVLIGDVRMPRAESLPATIKDLAYRNACHIDTGRDFNHHVLDLMTALKQFQGDKAAQRTPNRPLADPPTLATAQSRTSICSPLELEASGLSTDALIESLIQMDYDVLEGAGEKDIGLIERWKPIVENNSDGMRLAVAPDQDVLGYWHFLPLDDAAFRQAKAGALDDGLVTIDDLTILGPPGEYNLYFMIIAVRAPHRGVRMMRLLLDAFLDTLLMLSEQGIFFPEMCSQAFTPEGEAMCRTLKMQRIAEHHSRGGVYWLNLRPCPEQLFYLPALRAAYQRKYATSQSTA